MYLKGLSLLAVFFFVCSVYIRNPNQGSGFPAMHIAAG